MATGRGICGQQHHDSAFQLLFKGIDMSYWQGIAKWKCSSEFTINGSLTLISLGSLGMSGRGDVEKLLMKLKNEKLLYRNKHDPKELYGIYGGVVDSAFDYHFIKKYGLEKFRSTYGTDSMNKVRDEWYKSTEGKEWRNWHKRRLYGDIGLPVPKE